MISRIENIYVLRSESMDPAENMAMEQYLTLHCPDKACILFLWQNERAVVIGRNQSIRDEVDLEQAAQAAVPVMRRLSGGGAVYHDRGNLNYSFMAVKTDFDTEQQTRVIAEAIRRCGAQAEVTGRNDLTVDGRKVSGCAWYHAGRQHLQHGSILVSADGAMMDRLLTPSADKKARHGVPSSAARTAGLTEYVPGLTVETLVSNIICTFEEIYDRPVTILTADDIAGDAELSEYRGRFASREWNYGKELAFDVVKTGQFAWGNAQVCIRVNDDGDEVEDCVIYSDALDQEFIRTAEKALRGAEFDHCAMSESILSLKADGERFRVREDIAKILS